MFENFVDFGYVLSFAGMVIIVNMMTQFTKSLFDKIIQNRTKYVVYGWALLLCVLAAVFTGNWGTGHEVLQTVVTWMINSVVVWMTAMKAYELTQG